MKRATAVIVAVALVLSACGGSAGDSTSTTTPSSTTTTQPQVPTTTTLPEALGFEVIAADLPRLVATVDAADLKAVVDADTAFGLDVMRVVAGDGNTMVSPYSIATALSMLYAGARSTTADEIADVLHLSVDDGTLHAARNALDAALAQTPAPQGEDDTRAPFAIRPANSSWGQSGYPFLAEYLAVLATNYGAGLHAIDFASGPEAARQTINDWVEDATEDRIADLLTEGAIDVFTTLVLVNAIWFEANWASTFDPEMTEPGPFTLADGTIVTVPLMHQSIRTGYAETDTVEAVRLPYAGDAAMVVVLPKAGSPAELVATLEPADLEFSWSDSMVALTLPSFEFEADIPLTDVLKEMGMNAAFVAPSSGSDNEADLTGISAIRELYVTDVLHKTFIALDENGTEAAAATAVIVGRTSLPEPATFTANQPFLFFIEHVPTGEMLFLGQVMDPR